MSRFLSFFGKALFPHRQFGNLSIAGSYGLDDHSTSAPSTATSVCTVYDMEPSGKFTLHQSPSPTLLVLGSASFILALAALLLFLRRRQTRAKLEACGLPTVFWRPKFVNYIPQEDEGTMDSECRSANSKKHALSPVNQFPPKKCLPSSTITNILPRMERLKGPYGMYGTVYGVSTAVIHVAHPVPALTILSSIGSVKPAGTYEQAATSRHRQRGASSSTVAGSCGASKAPAYNHFKNFCGEGVFTADGDDWKRKRAAVMHVLLRDQQPHPACGSERITSFEAKVEQEAHLASQRLIRRLERLLQGNSEGCITANVVPLLQRATIGLIFRYITHSDLRGDTWDDDGIERPEPDAARCRHSTLPLAAMLSSYQKSITRIRMIILAQSRSIWFLLPRWVYHACSRMYREEERTMGPIRDFSRHACQQAQPGSPLSKLSTFAPYRTESTELGLSQQLLDEALTLLFAGQDTSAATLSWTLHLLSLYPDKQQKLAGEVRTVLAQTPQEAALDRKTLGKMPYLDAVVKESMRLYPVAPFVVRRLPFDVPIPKSDAHPSNVILPANALACIWIYSLHRHPKFWKSPNSFNPERWLANESTVGQDPGISNGAYMPFAVGPRNCIGQPLASIILRSLLARIIQHFEFRDNSLDDKISPESLRKDMQAGFTVLPQGGVHVSITKRSGAV